MLVNLIADYGNGDPAFTEVTQRLSMGLPNAQIYCLSVPPFSADLIFANFTNANLSKANLQGSTLNETLWDSAIVDECNFGVGIGITNKQRQELVSCGAIFSAI